MKKLFPFLMIMAIAVVAMAQTTTLTFTGVDVVNRHVQLDSVIVNNLSQNWRETIYWPDTTLVLNSEVGIDDVAGAKNLSSIQLSQNIPNPFMGITYANLTMAEGGDVSVEITDVLGRVVGAKKFPSQQAGTYQLCINLSSAGMYFLIARQGKHTASIKMINNGSAGDNTIRLLDVTEGSRVVDTKNTEKGTVTRPWANGDILIVMGYSTICGTEYSKQVPCQLLPDETITVGFQAEDFCDGLPCPGAATVTDIDNNTYNTVQIGNQCWMKENLRTSRYANGTYIPMSFDGNSYTEPYCYNPNNNANNVPTRGYLYNWPAVMQGASSSTSNPSGVQGVCPNGWHVPSDAEWTQLTSYVSSQSRYHCGDNSDNIAKALASTTEWVSSHIYETCTVGNDPSANNATGFSAIPAGCHGGGGDYFYSNALFWCATEVSVLGAYYYGISSSLAYVVRDGGWGKSNGFSVRCVRD